MVAVTPGFACTYPASASVCVPVVVKVGLVVLSAPLVMYCQSGLPITTAVAPAAIALSERVLVLHGGLPSNLISAILPANVPPGNDVQPSPAAPYVGLTANTVAGI